MYICIHHKVRCSSSGSVRAEARHFHLLPEARAADYRQVLSTLGWVSTEVARAIVRFSRKTDGLFLASFPPEMS